MLTNEPHCKVNEKCRLCKKWFQQFNVLVKINILTVQFFSKPPNKKCYKCKH